MSMNLYDKYEYHAPCKFGYVVRMINRLGFEAFMKGVDWFGIGLCPARPEDFTDDQWRQLGDILSEVELNQVISVSAEWN